jgi:extracellular elastinolytic metalloproteinase
MSYEDVAPRRQEGERQVRFRQPRTGAGRSPRWKGELVKPLLPRSLTRSKRSRQMVGLVCVAVLGLALVPGAGPADARAPQAAKPHAKSSGEHLRNYDSRTTGANREALEARKAAHPSAGVLALRKQLGTQGIIDIDPITATPRLLTRLDGFLTRPSGKSPVAIALSYVRHHQDVFGLNRSEVANLTLRKDYVDIGGTHHLSFTQSVNGVSVFGNGLKAHVDKLGRLVQFDGSPVAKLPTALPGPQLSAAEARRTAVQAVFGTSKATVTRTRGDAARTTIFSNGDRAQLVAFNTPAGTRLGWQIIDVRNGWLSVIDGQTGKTLFRQSLMAEDSGSAWDNYPGAPAGGSQRSRNLTAPGWLPNNSPRLAGNVAHVYEDVNDDDTAQTSEEVPPSGKRSFNYPFTPFGGANCAAGFVCSWDPDVPNSWQINAKQEAVQMFYFLGKYHDHLLKTPIGFTRAAGNFEAVDGDAVQGNAIDGANLNAGLPDANHVDNANMLTPPDGIAPRMQMYLFHEPGTSFPDEDPFLAGNSADEADIVYHEYTHGLSNRLVVDANGVSTLGNIQAGSMGEAWSDWYAMDFLVNTGFFRDTNAPGQLRIGEYVGWGNDLIRTQPVDCPVGSTSPTCPGTPGAGPGGYTYGDFGKIIGRPEVHADGEIWAETLWDLRHALGSSLTESLVTRAMELSPANPSYLDMRNSILQADLVNNGGKEQTAIWKVFAARGMGWFAAATDGDDTRPVEDFSMPPPANVQRGSLTGTVRDSLSNAPIANAVVAFGGHNSGFGDDYAATTDANGVYTINGILPGTYAKVFAKAPGFDSVVQTVSISSGSNTLNWTLRRDWAALSGGATVLDFNGVDYSAFGCGPGAIFDQSQGSGWSTDAVLINPADQADVDPRFVIVQLPVAVDIADIQINPSGTCGDGLSASTGKYSVETSPDGTTWTLASTPGAAFGGAERNRMNSIALNAGTTTGIQFLRYTMLGTQLHVSGGSCPGAFSACDFVDTVEFAVYGTPS